MNIKQKLGLGALVLGMGGCCSGGRYDSARIFKNISTDEIASRPQERYVVNTTINLSCVQADVTMDVWGYEIKCDSRRFVFFHSCKPGSDYLKSYDNEYFDDDLDGKIDRLSIDGVETAVSDGLHDVYRAMLEMLGKEKVRKLWEERWRSCKQ